MIPLCLLSGSLMRLEGSPTLLSRPLSVYEDLCRDRGLTFRKTEEGLLVQGRLTSGNIPFRAASAASLSPACSLPCPSCRGTASSG